MTQTEALKLALEALEPEFYLAEWYVNEHVIPAAIAAIKTVLAQPEPVTASDTSKKRVDETVKQRHEAQPEYQSTADKSKLEKVPAKGTLLAQPEQEPVATVYDAYDTTGIDWHCKDAPATGTKLYATPTQRTWVGLTDEERNDCLVDADPCECLATPEAEELMRCVEAKLKEKNT